MTLAALGLSGQPTISGAPGGLTTSASTLTVHVALIRTAKEAGH